MLDSCCWWLDKGLSRVFKGQTGFEFWVLRFRVRFRVLGASCFGLRFRVLRFGNYPPLSLAIGQTRLSGLSMRCPFWSNDNPWTTPSFPGKCRTTFPFFHSPRFFSSATIYTISPISGTLAVLRVIRWVSQLGCLHLFQAWFLASFGRLFLLHLLLPQWGGHFAPTSKGTVENKRLCMRKKTLRSSSAK